MRWLVVFLIAFAGCVASIPQDHAAITADLAAETAREVIRLRRDIAPTPVPPEPAPGSICENCEGRGYVGDGTVRVPCQPCGGTGKR